GASLCTGDWIKAGTRGANAVHFTMRCGASVILGPGALVEVKTGAHLLLCRGELGVTARENSALQVSVFGASGRKVEGRCALRAADEGLAVLEKDPKWLEGYRGRRSTEATGSLLAKVDGRNVPLSVGYHNVTVDIRDQIARTVVEESFVNHVGGVLEGVFYFPLPQDASISGFAMWIGEELVEADVVEKQRAREIFETILRERRDPGLLEWAGGNIFKARIFPIAGEKRIRITYTQVLPKTDGEYRYHYALQSDMLRLNPLKHLSIDVKVSSSEPIEKVVCPSHAARIQASGHAARAEFDAEEHVPVKDFELRIATRSPAKRLTLVPHVRGREGYFMLLVDAPKRSGRGPARVRKTIPATFLVMADTSGSMNGSSRENQIRFIDTLLSSLSEKDAFNVMTCDVEARWIFPEAVLNSASNREKAMAVLEDRLPMGWSDLEKAFRTVMDVIDATSQVIYVGDGVPTADKGDPEAFARVLKRIYGGKGVFHAVAPGTAHESTVLKAVAGLGGGSFRCVGGTTDAAMTAHELLEEIGFPVVKDLKVVVTGARAAALYPEAPPNLPAGRQQVIVGRYEPEDRELPCTMTVSGKLDGEEVRYVIEGRLPSSEAGNAFVPRFWARAHLDHLLAQGSNPDIRERIISLSQNYHIITPYTSFLVLESDEDRKRFDVKRRMRMRDAETFFQEGRDRAHFALKRKQMVKSEAWRLGIRSKVLRYLESMNWKLTLDLAREYGYGY
ncbi:MAG: VIT domain-containing protein, partial [Planctomycetota bacterium]